MNLAKPLIFVAFAASTLLAADDPILRDPKHLSLRNEVQLSIDRGLDWLKAEQQADGHWSKPEHPALTALPTMAFQRAPGPKGRDKAVLGKAYEFLRGNAKPDGGIYTTGLSNYNTSVAMMALLGSGEPKDEPLIESARKFIAGMQAKGMALESLDGGIGYGPTGVSPSRKHPDLDNTLVAIEALHAYSVARPNSELAASKDLDWKAAIGFLTRCQNAAEHSKAAWNTADPTKTLVYGDPANAGGFVYFPGNSKAGEVDLPGGGKALRSYGSMSYAGLLSFIYADVKKDDPRVVAALDWLRKNYTLEENPGLGKRGLYYYMHLMTKALIAADVQELTTNDGKKVDWKSAVAQKLISVQNGDGFWLNDDGGFMENDKVLVTSYGVLTLDLIYHQL